MQLVARSTAAACIADEARKAGAAAVGREACHGRGFPEAADRDIVAAVDAIGVVDVARRASIARRTDIVGLAPLAGGSRELPGAHACAVWERAKNFCRAVVAA